MSAPREPTEPTLDRRELLQRGAGLGLLMVLPLGASTCDGPDDAASSVGKCVLLSGDLGFSGTHVALLRTGKVLYWSYRPDPPITAEDNPNLMSWREWDPISLALEPLQTHNRNLFCAGHCFLPDGRLFVAGGQSLNPPTQNPFGTGGADHDTHTFNPATKAWERFESMPGARWYPTVVALPNGSSLVVGGLAARYPITTDNDEFEVFDWKTNSKTAPKHFNPGFKDLTYPFLKVLPDGLAGTLFVHAQNETRLLSLDTMQWSDSFTMPTTGSRTYHNQGACVLLPIPPQPGSKLRILIVGGQADDGVYTRPPLVPECKQEDQESASKKAFIFEFAPGSPGSSVWREPRGGQPAFSRFMGDAVLLPNGNVLLTNGAGRGVADCSFDPVMDMELFDTENETWTTLTKINHPRLYHSSASLLPDAQVVIAGNTRHWNPDNPVEDGTLELLTPPYLFRGSPRPKVLELPDKTPPYNATFEIPVAASSADVARVTLMRPSSNTHTNNMEQRLIELEIVGSNPDVNTVRAKTPPDTTVAPPGYYMLFVISSNGVPSRAHWVRLDAA